MTLSRSLRNRLTASTDPFRELSEVRKLIPPDTFSELLRFLPSVNRKPQTRFQVRGGTFRGSASIQRTSPLSTPFPKDPRSLLRGRQVLAPLTVRDELLWMSERIALYPEQINRYVALKAGLERSVLFQEDKLTATLLDTMLSELGHSFFHVETSIAFLQFSQGLEAQKRFLLQIQGSLPSGSITGFIAYNLSRKNEPATNPLAFPQALISFLNRSEIDQELQEFLLYRIFRHTPVGPSTSAILRWEQNLPIVDQYETLIDCCHAMSARPAEIAPALKVLRATVQDDRLLRLCSLVEDIAGQPSLTAAISLQYEETRAHALVEQGASTDALDYLQVIDPLRSTPYLLVLEAIARADLGGEHAPAANASYRGQLLLLLYRIIRKESDDYDVALFDLLRVTEAFSTFSLNKVFHVAILDAVTSLRRDRDYNTDIVAAFISDPHTALLAPTVLPPYIGLHLRAERERLDQTPDGHNHSPTPREVNDALRAESHAYLDAGDIQSSLTTIANGYIHNSRIWRMLPIQRCIDSLKDESISAYGGGLSLPIVYDLYLRYVGDDRPYIRSDAYEDFLSARGYSAPSDISPPLDDTPQEHLNYFLWRICTPEVMLHSDSFASSREVEDERIRVLELLRRADPSNSSKYEAALRKLTREQIIQQGLRHIEQSKFAISSEPLRRWAEKNLREGYTRLQDLIAAGVKDLAPKTNAASDLQTDALATPEDELTASAGESLARFVQEAFTNSSHGLDSYLSMRARHGSFSGHIRSVLEEESILTVRDSRTEQYRRNDFWLSRLRADASALEHVDKLLRDFARAFDGTVQSFTNERLQIKSHEKPKGLFTFDIYALDALFLAADVENGKGFDGFLDRCFQVFWQNVESSTGMVRDEIDAALKPELERLFSALVSDVATFREVVADLDDFIGALRRAQTNLQSALEVLKEWFRTPKALPELTYTMDQVVDISLKQVKKLHPEFDPVVQTEIVIDHSLVNLYVIDLPRFSDIFFNIWENIQRHSGVGNEPEVLVRVTTDGGRLTLYIENDMAYWEGVLDRLNNIRTVIDADRFQKVVKTEGGTGLAKLWNTVRGDGASLDFGLLEDRFFVRIVMPTMAFVKIEAEEIP